MEGWLAFFSGVLCVITGCYVVVTIVILLQTKKMILTDALMRLAQYSFDLILKVKREVKTTETQQLIVQTYSQAMLVGIAKINKRWSKKLKKVMEAYAEEAVKLAEKALLETVLKENK